MTFLDTPGGKPAVAMTFNVARHDIGSNSDADQCC